MPASLVAITAAPGRARVELTGAADYGTVDAAAILPRLLSRGPNSARVALIAGGAMLLGGDAVELQIDVGAGCTLELEDIGGTVAYDGEGRRSRWSVSIRVGDGALLCWNGKPLVIADGADVRRSTELRLGMDARVLLRETTVLGRVGEVGGSVELSTHANDSDGPLLIETLHLIGGQGKPGVAGDHRVFDSVLALGFCPQTTGLAMRLETPGALARHLGAEAHLSPLDEVWAQWHHEACPH